MPNLEIITAPSSVLKKKAKLIDFVDDKIRSIMSDMLVTMYREEGVGLAANQVGILKKIIVIDLQHDDETERKEPFYPLFMANPEITYSSDEMTSAEEGCLSVPGQRIEVLRPMSIIVQYLDYNNKKCQLSADGWLARAIQHEVDHLEGKLLIDYLSPLKKNLVIRKLTKLKKISA